ncbi:hypothetical protein AHF37_05857 [Paragonimus kellicotti]|nr:hypothetical protein AHF37_05857 [Paragonimus kellicotti]
MCLNYIFYYPQSKLELCKSEVSQPELDEFLFNYITECEVALCGWHSWAKVIVVQHQRSVKYGNLDNRSTSNMPNAQFPMQPP